MRSRNVHSAVRACLSGVVAAMVLATEGANAQLTYSGTGFIHGFASNGSIWTTAYPELGGQSTISFVSQLVELKETWAPTFDTLLTFSQITSSLNQTLAAKPTPQVVAAHSMGGMAARYSYHSGGTGAANTAAIVTVATPHLGVILADSADKVSAFLRDVDRRVVAAKHLIEGTILAMVFAELGTLATFVVSRQFPEDPSFSAGTAGLLTTPALPALKTNSAEIATLRASAADAAIPRANIVAQLTTNKFMPLRLAAAFKGESEQKFIDRFQKFRSVIHACKVAYYATIVGIPLARKCGWAERVLGRLDETWQRYSSGTTIRWDVLGRRVVVPRDIPSDGVVPNELSAYPNSSSGPGKFFQMQPVGGANHMSVYKVPEGAKRIAQALAFVGEKEVAGIAPLGAYISGPTSISANTYYTWTANPSGGVKPYTYEWSVGALRIGTASTVTYRDSESFGLQLTVSDAGGQRVTTLLQVTVTGIPRS